MKNSKYKKKYKKHLQSGKWLATRIRVISLFKGVCQDCKKKTRYPQIHHLHYKNVFNEKIEDLTLLCKKCHQKEHGIIDIKYSKKTFKRLMAENVKLKSIIEDAIKIKMLWLPGEDWKEEYKNEAQALMAMAKRFESVLK